MVDYKEKKKEALKLPRKLQYDIKTAKEIPKHHSDDMRLEPKRFLAGTSLTFACAATIGTLNMGIFLLLWYCFVCTGFC